MPEYDGYNRDIDRYNDQGEGLIQNFERRRYNGIRPKFSDEGANIPLSYHFKEESELYARFGSGSELEEDETQEVAQASGQVKNLTPDDEREINQVFQAGIPTAIVGTYGTTLGTKVIWQSFAKVIIQRFGAVAAQALGLSAADGLLPVGEAIALGLLAVTAWQIARNWDELWAEANDLLDQQFLETYIPPPKELPAFPDAKKADGKTPIRGGGGYRKRWKEQRGKKRIIEWDSQHGKVEVYNKRGKHLGEFDPETGEQTKPADKSRRVEP